MHPDDLKTIWECRECGRRFFYHSDVANHVKESRHLDMVSRDLHARRAEDSVFLRRNVSLTFRLDNRPARVEIDCKFYPSTESLVYTSVSYTSEKLQRMIEGSEEMMNKVDRYIRNLFQAQLSQDPST